MNQSVLERKMLTNIITLLGPSYYGAGGRYKNRFLKCRWWFNIKSSIDANAG